MLNYLNMSSNENSTQREGRLGEYCRGDRKTVLSKFVLKRRRSVWRHALEEMAYTLGTPQRRKKYEKKGFSSWVAAIYSKLFWKNCPTQDKRRYLNSKCSKMASMYCGAWCESDLYCWHFNVVRLGTNNDISVRMWSQLLKDVDFRRFSFRLTRSYCIMQDGVERTLQYFLRDLIIPSWPLLKNQSDMRQTWMRDG